MTTEMNHAIEDAIKNHLPSEMCSVVAERLKQADVLEKANKFQASEIERLTSANIEATQLEQKLRDELSQHKTLDEREATLEKAARDLDVTMLTQKIELMTTNEAKMAEHTALLLRNTEFRAIHLGERSDPTFTTEYDAGGNPRSSQNGTMLSPTATTVETTAS